MTKSQCFYVVGHDSADGRLRMFGGRLALDWPTIRSQPVFKRAEKLFAPILEKLGARYVQNPLRDKILGGRLVSVHPLGGCAMGENAGQGVVDHMGRAFNPAGEEDGAVHEGLLVLDGSIIPTSLGANPLLTITALAERSMTLLARNMENDDIGERETTRAGEPSPLAVGGAGDEITRPG
jgi:cholesterol oxidase